MRRGEIWSVDLEPTKGREQRGRRPVMIVSPEAFNLRGLTVVCPITGGGQDARTQGFVVSLSGAGMKTDGIVLCHQLRALDLKEGNAKRIEKSAPDFIVSEVLARISAIFD